MLIASRGGEMSVGAVVEFAVVVRTRIIYEGSSHRELVASFEAQ
jgi:hypothetical protein